MAPSPLRKRLTNEDKMKIIEESKQPGFCRKKTMDKYGISRSAISVILLKQKEFLKTMDSSPIAMNTYMYFGEKLASQITFECLFLQMKGKVPYILQNNGDLMINAEFLFNLIPHMMFRDKFVIVDYL